MDDIEIVPYDPTWPLKFEAEAARLRMILPNRLIVDIQHYGSTAVPGLAAKSIIDIILATSDLTAARAAFPPLLAREGYVFWADNPEDDRLFFVKGLPPGAPHRTHHLHVGETRGQLWSQLAFRDHLRAHPEDAAAYAALKRALAGRYRKDREAYTAAKGHFIQAMIKTSAP